MGDAPVIETQHEEHILRTCSGALRDETGITVERNAGLRDSEFSLRRGNNRGDMTVERSLNGRARRSDGSATVGRPDFSYFSRIARGHWHIEHANRVRHLLMQFIGFRAHAEGR